MSKSLVWIYEKSAQSMLCWTLLFCCIVNEEIKEKQTCPAVLFKAQLKPGWSFAFLCFDQGCSLSSSIHFLSNSLAPSVGRRKIMQLQIYVLPFLPGGGSSCEWSSGFTCIHNSNPISYLPTRAQSVNHKRSKYTADVQESCRPWSRHRDPRQCRGMGRQATPCRHHCTWRYTPAQESAAGAAAGARWSWRNPAVTDGQDSRSYAWGHFIEQLGREGGISPCLGSELVRSPSIRRGGHEDGVPRPRGVDAV